MSSSRRVAVSVILTGMALFAGSIAWLATRKLVALDVPMSLSRGHIRSEEFSINLHSSYYIEIEVDGSSAPGNVECLMLGCNGTPSTLKARWALSSAGQTEVSGSSDNIDGESGALQTVERKIGYFESSGGRFILNVDVLSDSSVLNKGKPRLKVEADEDGYNYLSRMREGLPILPGIVVVVGVVLLLLSRSKDNFEETPGLGISEVRTAALFFRPHPFAIYAAFLMALLMMSGMVLHGLTLPHPRNRRARFQQKPSKMGGGPIGYAVGFANR